MRKTWRAGDDVRLDDIDPASTPGAPGDRTETEATFAESAEELSGLQDRLWAEGRQSLLVVLQAMDAGGKDGTVKHVFGGLNPQGIRVASFKEPTAVEQAHDFLWRIHQHAPAAGEIVIFNRSYYEDVLIPRVHKSLPPKEWKACVPLLRGFEELLAHGRTRVVKVFLHISRKEQAKRFEDRERRPDKQWKLQPSDRTERKRWPAYQRAYADLIAQTSTEAAPWYVIPADHKWYRNWAVSTILAETLRDMDPRYPRAP